MYPSQQQQQPTGGKTTSRVITKLGVYNKNIQIKKGVLSVKPRTKRRNNLKLNSGEALNMCLINFSNPI